MTKYCYQIDDDDYLRGFSDTAEQAAALGRTHAKEDYPDQSVAIHIWDARPATDADKELWENCDEDGDCDTSKPDWFVDKWVPENLVQTVHA